MSTSFTILLISTASIAFFHTILGPDHYLPFIGMAKANNWPKRKLFSLTAVCGINHIFTSVLIALIGIWSGKQLSQIELLNSIRGEMAAWILIGIGILYTLWGIKYASRKIHHRHMDVSKFSKQSAWALILFFLLGPCEPLIPLLMVSGLQFDYLGIFLIISVFIFVTIATMVTIVYIGINGLNHFNLKPIEPYFHLIAGSIIIASGLSIQFLGL